MEVRRVGKSSNARRPMSMAEFRKAIRIFERENNFENRYRFPTMIKYQYHLIARCDDIGNFETRDLGGHSNPVFSSFCLQTKVYWSKNVMEERDCPAQILLGCNNVDYFILLSLAVYLEVWLIVGNGKSSTLMFSDENDINGDRKNVDRLKKRYSSRLTQFIFHNREFAQESIKTGGLLGSHSLRKYPATFARSNGCNADDIDIRGRWKRNSRRISDRYVDVAQHYIDAKVAAALCVGGPVRYKLVDGSGVTKAWLRNIVVPGIASFFDENDTIADVLALPLLWACFDVEYSTKLPDWLIATVRMNYAFIKVLPDDITNPVIRVPLLVYQVNGELRIEEMDSEYNNINNNNDNNNINSYRGTNQQQQNSSDQLNAILIQQQKLSQQLSTISDRLTNSVSMSLTSMGREVDKKINVLNKNIKRLMLQPTTRRAATNNNNPDNNNNVEGGQLLEEEAGRVSGPLVDLSSCPKNLYDLWAEYTTGLGGRKAARDFTTRERGGKLKFKFCQRKVFWDCIVKHVNAGYTAHTAIDRVYGAYGIRLPVSTILALMIKDRKNKTEHVNLQL